MAVNEEHALDMELQAIQNSAIPNTKVNIPWMSLSTGLRDFIYSTFPNIAAKFQQIPRLPFNIGEDIVATLSDQQQLTMERLAMFKECRMNVVKLDNMKDDNLCDLLALLEDHKDSLQSLSLRRYRFFISEAAIKKLYCLQRLEILDLGDNTSTKMHDVVCSLNGITNLTKLCLDHTDLFNLGVDKLCMSPPPKLTHLDLTSSNITGLGLEHLHRISGLRDLNLSGNGIYNTDGIQLIKNLKVLDLSSTHVTARCMPEFQMMQLEKLDLANTPIGNTALQLLINMPLSNLNLSDCRRITDKGMKCVVKIKSLKTLTLSDTMITDQGLLHLAGASLEKLDLVGSPVTKEGVRQLQLPCLTELTVHPGVSDHPSNIQGCPAIKHVKTRDVEE